MSEFYEPDESAEKVVKAFDSGKKGTTVSQTSNARFNDLFAKLVEEGKIIATDPTKPPVQFKDIKGI